MHAWKGTSATCLLVIGICLYLCACFLFSVHWTSTLDSACGITELSVEKFDSDGPQQALNQERRMTIARYCHRLERTRAQNLRSSDWIHLNDYKKPRLFYSDNAQFIFCETPKCGSTQWRNLLLLLDGYIEGYAADMSDYFSLSWRKNYFWTRFDATDHAAASEANKRLQKYYKVMTVREPLERLVSAYREKLETDKNSEYRALSKQIHKRMNPGSQEGLASFEDFVDYILSTEDPTDLDPHWQPYSTLCDPCKIHYDYIAKMETIYADVPIITERIGTERDRIFNGTGRENFQSERASLTHLYLSQIPYEKRLAIFRYYKDQYDIFRYDYPDFITLTNVSV